jgi:outer membrane receptor for ferrienterochelin and colicin
VEGRFILNLSSAATIQIEITAIGFTGKTISDVSSNGEELNITLTSSSNNLQAVTVQTSARRESTNSLIQFQKNTNAVAQVVSAEAIRRSPDKNTGEALRRVTGLSMLDGKYIVVRGLSDRYNQAMLNGVLLSSTEPDRKTFLLIFFPLLLLRT